jgi:hypothetical protein
VAWPFLVTEPDIANELRDAATELQDILEREAFFRDFPKIDQNAAAIETEYQRRQAVAVAARVAAYEKALEDLHTTPGWTNLTPEDQKAIALPLEIGRAKGELSASILQVRSDAELCPIRLQKAIATVRRTIDGDRLATIDLRPYFADGIETEEQLNAALTGIREECARLIGVGKKVVIG